MACVEGTANISFSNLAARNWNQLGPCQQLAAVDHYPGLQLHERRDTHILCFCVCVADAVFIPPLTSLKKIRQEKMFKSQKHCQLTKFVETE